MSYYTFLSHALDFFLCITQKRNTKFSYLFSYLCIFGAKKRKHENIFPISHLFYLFQVARITSFSPYQQFSFRATVAQSRIFVILYVMPRNHCIALERAMYSLLKHLSALELHIPLR